MQAIILAGGLGSRLKPFTLTFPKPLMPIGNQPILEILLRQLRAGGCDRVTLAVNHLAELIMAFCGDGSKFGLKITYSREDEPQGTAAPLRLLDELDDNFLMLNGDILTTLSFGSFFERHLAQRNDLTIFTHEKTVPIDLGVLELDDKKQFRRYIEKPVYRFTVSTGIYAMSRSIVSLIPRQGRFDMPDLVTAAGAARRQIGIIDDAVRWLDIGRPDDYEIANELFEANQREFLP
jgi:NDP-sugar pyrophosphorylase family protein